MAITSISERFSLHALSWLSNLLGIALFILTVMYACGSYSLAGFKRVRTSSSNTILVLRVLSELTSILFSINLSLTLENIKWRLVTRFEGQLLPDFLSLVPGTGVFGLTQLVLSRGSPLSSWRIWSLGRLVMLALIPTLGIIIFSDITTQLGYHVETTTTGPYSGAMGDFNSSKAVLFGPAIDSFIGMGFADFFSDSRRVIDITSNAKDAVPCSTGFSKTTNQTCDQSFFMPGLVVDLDLLTNASVPQADMFVMYNTPGYMLNFTTPNQNTTFDMKHDCRVFGYKIAAFEICVIGQNGLLELRLNTCMNAESAMDSNCLADRNWPRSDVASTKAQISVRNATVGFSRLNSTILTYKLAESWSKPNISGTDILAAFDGFFSAPKSEGIADLYALINSVLAPTKITYAPIWIVATVTMNKISSGASSTTMARNKSTVQALLALTLHYCSGAFGRLMPSPETIPTDGNMNITMIIKESFGKSPNATYSLASTSYNLVVSPATIWLYAIIGGLFLLINLGVTFFCTFMDTEQERPMTTSYADVDHRLLKIDVPMAGTWRGPRWACTDRVCLRLWPREETVQRVEHTDHY